MEKAYPVTPSIIWNAVADIVEMRKGKITRNDEDSMTLETEMYGIKTKHCFRIVRDPPETKVFVETEGESDEDRRSVQLIFATLDNMLGTFVEE